MRSVMHVISGLGIGGAESNLVQVAQALKARGISQYVVSLTQHRENATPLEAHGIAVSHLNIRRSPRAIGDILKLCRIVYRMQPRIIQGWMYHGNLVASLAHRLTPGWSRRRLIWGLRASNMDEARYRRINRWSARISHWPDVIVANSLAGARVHEAYGYKPARMEVIWNGVDTQRFAPNAELRGKLRREFGIPDGQFVAIHVARVDPMKDHPMFLSAMARVPGATGLLVGTGTERLTLPPNVRALGMRLNVDRLLPVADVVVSTSAFGEGFSNVIAEGMSAGLVPITTDVGDARVIVGETGVVIPPRDSDALVTALAAEADLSPQDRARRGALARRRIEQEFALSKSVDAFERLYASLGIQ